ncbi:MAG: prolipoprotein diacylglyceryl transferase [candidate division Zixibacteria bacterium]|nr:prolipoprotein diacylglyceryl transferase [candidate division Zixibacteria bacterium]
MNGVEYYVHDIDRFAIHFWGNVGIRWYGLSYAAGFGVALLLLHLLYKKGKSPLTPSQQSGAMLALAFGVLVGARVGHVLLYDLKDTLADPLSFFAIWKGGMASHGGFVGVMIAGWWVSRTYGISPGRLGDILTTLAPPGLMFGRLANFINGELWGTVTNVPWAVIFPQSAPPGTPIAAIPPRHPSQLYEAALEGLALILYTQWRIWRTDVQKNPGQLSGEFLILYAIVRTIGEQFREYDSPPILGLSRGIFYSLFLAALGVVFIWRSRRKTA